MRRYLKTASHYLFVKGMSIGITEGQIPTQHGEEYNSATPNIRHQWIITLLSLYYLRGGVAW